MAFLISVNPASKAAGSIVKPSALVPFLILDNPKYKKSLAIILFVGVDVKLSNDLIATSTFPFS